MPSISKVFERTIHDQLTHYFVNNKLFYDNQYGFRNAHSTELAALELVNRLIKHMDSKGTPLSIFLDLSKAFDTIDYDILLYKLCYYGIKNKALKLIESYLHNRRQYVSYSSTESTLLPLRTGVPQGSILGPLLFIIYMNDLNAASSKFHPILYADDTTLIATLQTFVTDGQDGDASRSVLINNSLQQISLWLQVNKLSLNSRKTKAMIFHTPQKRVLYPRLIINDNFIEYVNEFDYLGIVIDTNLNWKAHISKISLKLSKTIGIMYKLKKFISGDILLTLYNSLLLPHLSYGLLCWKPRLKDLIKLQKKAVRIISAAKYNAHTDPIFKKLSLLKLDDICRLKEYKFCYQLENQKLPSYFMQLFSRNVNYHYYNTRTNSDFHLPLIKHEFARNCIEYMIPISFNNCPSIIKNKIYTHSFEGYSQYIKKYILSQYNVSCTIPECYVCINQ